MGLFDQATSQPQQGLMGLAQQPQPNYMGQPSTQEVLNYQMPMSNDMNGFMVNDSTMGQPQAMQSMQAM